MKMKLSKKTRNYRKKVLDIYKVSNFATKLCAHIPSKPLCLDKRTKNNPDINEVQKRESKI